MTLDELRDAHPNLGVAVYAMTPGGAVTLELYDEGQVYSFVGATEAAAIEKAFPPVVRQTPSGAGLAPASRPACDVTVSVPGEAGGVAPTTASVFD